MRPLLLLASLALAVAPAADATSLRRVAEVAFENRAGQPERWRLEETQLVQGAERVVERRWLDDGVPVYVERAVLGAAGVTRIEVADWRPGGTDARLRLEGTRLVFEIGGAEPRTVASRVDGEVLTFGTVAPRLAALRERDPTLRRHEFVVPIVKAEKAVPIRAELADVDERTFAVVLTSTNVVVQRFFMRRPFRMLVERGTGRVVRYAGQLEPYDLSSGSARSITAEYGFPPDRP